MPPPPEKSHPFMKPIGFKNSDAKSPIDFNNHFRVPDRKISQNSPINPDLRPTPFNKQSLKTPIGDYSSSSKDDKGKTNYSSNVLLTASEENGNNPILPTPIQQRPFTPFAPLKRPATAGPFVNKPQKSFNLGSSSGSSGGINDYKPHARPLTADCTKAETVGKHGYIPSTPNSYVKAPNHNQTGENPQHLNSTPSLISNEDVTCVGDFLNIPSLLRTCRQKAPVPIDLAIKELRSVKKLGEGVYGEVFIAYKLGCPDKSVFKIIPYGGSKKVNGEFQKTSHDIEQEVLISKELNRLREGCRGTFCNGFAYLKESHIVQGRYPRVLVDKWKEWHAENKSENDLPAFENRQKYVILEYEYAGRDIESFTFDNAKQSFSLLIQVIHCLGAAEAALGFEHRDLHWGNILVHILKDKDEPVTFTLTGNTVQIPSCGIRATLIDYTISRLTNREGKPIFTDLSTDEDQFNGSEEYQFEIYRMMRDANNNIWHTFCPKSNVFWCHYLTRKLIGKAYYREEESSTHRRYIQELKTFEKSILSFPSCFDFCVSYYSELLEIKKRQPQLYKQS